MLYDIKKKIAKTSSNRRIIALEIFAFTIIDRSATSPFMLTSSIG